MSRRTETLIGFPQKVSSDSKSLCLKGFVHLFRNPSWASCTISPSSIKLDSYAAAPLVVTVATTQSAQVNSTPLQAA